MASNDIKSRIPEGAWDSHIHVVDPKRYALAPEATYRPGVYTVWDNVVFETSIGAVGTTIIQPSIYGNDNTMVIEALKAYGPERSRGVVVFDPSSGDTKHETLEHWHSLGVRGVRANLGFVEAPTAESFAKRLKQYADAIRPFDWVLQMYIPLSLIGKLEHVFPTLGVRIVFDHMGHPDLSTIKRSEQALDPYEMEGFPALINLLRQGKTWVKVSAPYRLSKSDDGHYSDLDTIVRELLKEAPDRAVYASDWPHVLHEGLDIKPWTSKLLDIVGDDERLKIKLFRDNAKQLWT